MTKRRFGWRTRIGFVRVAAYASLLFLVGTGVVSHSAIAQVREGTLEVGRDLFDLKDLLRDGNPVRLNGEKMYFTSTGTDESYEVVLERFRKHCEEHPAAFNAAFPGAKPGDGPSGLPVVHKLGEAEGVVMCLAKSGSSVAGLLPALETFLRTHNLGALGSMRYAYVRRPASGRGSQILAAWTDEKFDMEAFLPKEGTDAPGRDPVTAPRPPGAIRRFSAILEKTEYASYIYRVSGTESEVMSYYDDFFRKRGWFFAPAAPATDPLAGGGRQEGGAAGRLYIKTPENLSFLVSLRKDGDVLSVTLTEGLAPSAKQSY